MSLEEAFRKAYEKYVEYADKCHDCSAYQAFIEGVGEYPCDVCTIRDKVIYWMKKMTDAMDLILKKYGKEEGMRIIKRIVHEVRGEGED